MTDASADYHKGFRESNEAWKDFSRYVTEMVGEVVLRWEVLNRSSSEESMEPWKKNIGELRRFACLFDNFRWYDADVQTKVC